MSKEADAAPLRLGCRGPLDPLLYMRVSTANATDDKTDAPATAEASESQRKDEDLRSALRRCEAEYTAVLLPGKADHADMTSAELRKGGRDSTGRGRQATPGRSWQRRPARGRTPPPRNMTGGDQQQQQQQQQQQRGKKRRPIEQEPRPVSGLEPAPRKVQALPEVEAFLAEHRVRCLRVSLKSSFRSIKFGQEKKKRQPPAGKLPKASANADIAKGNAPDQQPDAPMGLKISSVVGDMRVDPEKEQPPWEKYLDANKHFAQMGQFMHTVAWEAGGRQILTVLPHPTRVDVDVLARAVQQPRKEIRQRKLKEIERQTGWPVFVCPPIGHPKDAEGRPPLLLVDSTAIEQKKPLLFDCGTVGLSIPASEFFRSTGAACIEGLGKIPPPGTFVKPAVLPCPVSDAASLAPASPEPAPEPGPNPGGQD